MNPKAMIDRLLDRMIKLEKIVETAVRRINDAPLNMGMAKVITIASGAIEATRPNILLLPETGSSDNLDTITNGADGKMIVLAMGENAKPITVRDYSVGGGNIDLHGSSWILDNLNASLALYFMGATNRWHLVSVPKLDDLRNVDAEAGAPGDVLVLQGDGTWLAVTPVTGATAFIDLTDVPAAYTGAANKLVAVKATEDGLEFVTGSGGAVDSVNGQTGVVVLDTDDIAEGTTNLYWDDDLAIAYAVALG